ncbi:MAG TPA: hypothetical protein VLF40_06065 [Candidatus Saccharimonadales bacterium]|nr:hypothetical protein [Candidatus Saccharimonadales bacterium]
MAEQDDSKRPYKITISDKSGDDGPKSAPELDDAEMDDSYEPKDDAPKESKPKDGNDDDPDTDKAVDDIMKTDGDEVLKKQDEDAEKSAPVKAGFKAKLKHFFGQFWSNKKLRWTSIGVLVVALGVLFGLPVTRYNILGVVLKADVTVQAVDSKSGAPVSGALVKVGTKTATTEADGKAVLHVHLGTRTIKASKTYYTGSTEHGLVGMVASQNSFKVKLVALGRQVKVKVVNKVTTKPVAGAEVAVGTSKAKTDKDGLATVVVPSGATTQEASVALSGFNTAKVSIVATGDVTKNTFGIVPAGKLYFLSNLSGNLDVVKTDLDGSNRQVVLEGTGSEDKTQTSLLASRDWKYLALLSKRSGGDNASLYLIDTTAGDKLTTIDEGNADFKLIGWSGDRFIYQVNRHIATGQKNQQALKSFDPTSGHTLLLDQTDATTYAAASGSGPQHGAYFEGDATAGYITQNFGNAYLSGGSVVYVKNWQSTGWHFTANGRESYLNGKSAELDSIGADGAEHKVLKTFAPSSIILMNTSPDGAIVYITVDTVPYGPQAFYLVFTDSSTEKFYEYEDGKVSDATGVTDDTVYGMLYYTYLLSPSGSSTFWAEPRDGKNTLFTGNVNGKSPKQVAALSEYNTYGWYTDDYLLVSKSSSELYIIPAVGGTPLKITDYYKPAYSYYGYGGGYGGL